MKNKFKRIVALIGVVILALMYIMSLVFAVLRVSYWQRFFFACMGMTIIIPAFIWLIMILYDAMMKRRELEEGQVRLTHGK